MALIGQIRKHIWIVVVLIALGLGGFILQDMLSGQQSIFGSQQTFIGKIDGENVDWNQFYNVEQMLYGNSGGDVFARRTALWNYFVEEKLVREQAEELGLGVSKDELIELQFGTNLSPIINARFQNQQTRQVDREQLNLIRQQIESNSIDPTARRYWAHQEKEIIKERIQEKMSNMAAKAIYTPTWMAEMMMQDQNERVDLALVNIPYDNVETSEVSLSDADFKAYFEENKSKNRQDKEKRKVQYVVFNVAPSTQDSANLRKQIADLIPGFATAENDSLYVDNNFGYFSNGFVPKDQVSAAFADTLFNAPVGAVVGPYLDQNAYIIAKLVGRQMVADSADTRHILIGASTPEEYTNAEVRIDSMKNVLETGAASFDSLAGKFSQDQGSSAKGGKYEAVTPGQFVAEYDEVLFRTGQIGQLYKVKTQFGWHLVEILKRSASQTPRAKIAYIQQAVEPSDDTQKDALNRASRFAQEHRTLESLKKAADTDPELELITSSGFERNDYILGDLGSGQSSRDIIRWAFGDDANLGRPDVGAVSPQVYGFQEANQFYTNKYVIAGLTHILKAGIPSWESLRNELEPLVVNRKKAEIIKGRINTQDLYSIASAWNVKIDTVRSVNFANATIGALGQEPKIVASAVSMNVNATSQPMEGNSGVVVFTVINKTGAQAGGDINSLKTQYAAPLRGQVNARLIQAMRKNMDITDNRARFY